MKAFFDSLHSLQPIQGLLADVKSFNMKNHLGDSSILCERNSITRKERQHKNKESQSLSGSALHMIYGYRLPFIVSLCSVIYALADGHVRGVAGKRAR